MYLYVPLLAISPKTYRFLFITVRSLLPGLLITSCSFNFLRCALNISIKREKKLLARGINKIVIHRPIYLEVILGIKHFSLYSAINKSAKWSLGSGCNIHFLRG
jgi:hypothetical protein